MVKGQSSTCCNIGYERVVGRSGVPDLFLIDPLIIFDSPTHHPVEAARYEPAILASLRVVQIYPTVFLVVRMQCYVQQPAMPPDQYSLNGIIEHLWGAGNELRDIPLFINDAQPFHLFCDQYSSIRKWLDRKRQRIEFVSDQFQAKIVLLARDRAPWYRYGCINPEISEKPVHSAFRDIDCEPSYFLW